MEETHEDDDDKTWGEGRKYFGDKSFKQKVKTSIVNSIATTNVKSIPMKAVEEEEMPENKQSEIADCVIWKLNSRISARIKISLNSLSQFPYVNNTLASFSLARLCGKESRFVCGENLEHRRAWVAFLNFRKFIYSEM